MKGIGPGICASRADVRFTPDQIDLYDPAP